MMRAGDALAAIRGFPEHALDEITGGRPVLVLAPHPDDESLGCGGLIAAASKGATPASVMVMTDGAGSHPGSRAWPPARLRELRAREAVAATAILGVPRARLRFAGLPDRAAPREGVAFDRAVAAIVAHARDDGCGVLAAPWIGDPHGDHVAVQMMARAAARFAGLRLLSYPVWGWVRGDDEPVEDTLPLMGYRLSVATHLERKRLAVAAHVSQFGGLIEDDADGFVLPAALLTACDGPFEHYIVTVP